MLTPPIISFIIPAFNEKHYIENTLKQLHKFSPEIPYEVIIVDNGSTDNTKEVAQAFNDTVLSCPNGTIAAVRNHGVNASKGNILIFLDADVELTNEWQKNIEQTIIHLNKTPLMITGSRCLPPDNSNIINKHWFEVLVLSNSNIYINSGHLITTRVLFNNISGFDETLKTAEDHDFCVRAQKMGAIILSNSSLKVIHDGYPTTITEFIKRERWHGREDFKTISSIIKSKTALITILHVCLLLMSLIIISTDVLKGAASYFLLMAIFTIAITLYKFKNVKLKSLFRTSLLHYLYIIGRTLSLFDRVTQRYSKKFR